jgi:molybdopterin-guanine dinucleotide biosynthesis protein A
VPTAAGDTVRWIADSIEGGGPAAAMAEGVAALEGSTPPAVLLLAGDLPFLTADALEQLLARLLDAAPDVDGAVAVDTDGRAQWLLSAWRPSALRHRISSQGTTQGSSLHGLLGSMSIEHWKPRAMATREPWRDCDDAEQLEAVRRLPE